jgi:glutamate carboxypeptidase
MDNLIPKEILQHTTDLLVELCAISSSSGDLDGLRRVAQRLGAELGRRGLSAEIGEELAAGGVAQPVLVARAGAAGETPLLLVGHLDTVLSAVPPVVRDGRLEATGALDMKGGLATLVGALDLMAARGEEIPADLMFVGVPDEEVSGVIAESLVRRWGDGARAVLVLEPGETRDGGETIVAGRRGMTEWHLEATGRSSHSGLAYWEGRSAAVAVADWAVRAQGLSRPGPGVTVNVARIVGGDADFVDNLAGNHEMLGTTTRRNVISERAVAEGEIRFLSPADRGVVLTALEAMTADVAGRHGVELCLRVETGVPPVDPNGPGRTLADRAVSLAVARGWKLSIEEDRGGISFPNYLSDASTVAVVDGLGPVGEGMHTRGEILDLVSLERRIALLADLLATLRLD